MLHFELDTVDLERRFGNAAAQIGDGIATAVGIACREGADEARTRHRYKDQTGDLTRSIDGRLESWTSDGGEGVIEATAQHASLVEEGTRAHVISPKADAGQVGPLQEGQSRRSRAETKALKAYNRAAGRGATTGRGMLAWEAVAGDWHFARVVHHPGTKPYGFMAQAHDKCERVLIREIEDSVQRIASRI